jgi:glycosidase
MAVILDWAANHTSWDNDWITTHPDWYQKMLGKYYYSSRNYYNDVAQLDFTNTEMQVMIDAMSYWIYSANVDGFRCDYADFVPQKFWSEAISSLRKIKKNQILMLAEGTKVSQFVAGFDFTFDLTSSYFGKKFCESKSATTYKIRMLPNIHYNLKIKW